MIFDNKSGIKMWWRWLFPWVTVRYRGMSSKLVEPLEIAGMGYWGK
jgi:hypothetical protein